jgi:hypothetical protein
MSQTATRPWWAEVEHLRPDAEGGTTGRAREERATPRTASTGRFDRRGPHATASAAATRRPRERQVEVWLDESPALAPAKPPKAAQPAERRTIEIRGQADRVHGVAPVPSAGPQRIRGRRADERVGPRPDRIALWAVLLGLLLILVAVISSPGADAAVLLAGWL